MDNRIKVLQLDFRVDECDAEVYVNGIPLERHKTMAQAASISLLPYVVEGINTLELVVNVGPTPSRAEENAETVDQPRRTQGKCFAEAKVVRYPEGVYPNDPSGQVLASLGLDASVAPDARPRIARTTFEIKKGDEPNLMRWAWVDADKIDLKRDAEAIRRTVEYVWQCFSKGEYTAEMFALERISIEERYRAYPAGDDVETTRKNMEEYFSGLPKKPNFAMEPLDPRRFDFRLCADGHLVQVINKDWVLTVTSTATGPINFRYDYPMFLGKVKGKFVALRP